MIDDEPTGPISTRGVVGVVVLYIRGGVGVMWGGMGWLCGVWCVWWVWLFLVAGYFVGWGMFFVGMMGFSGDRGVWWSGSHVR